MKDSLKSKIDYNIILEANEAFEIDETESIKIFRINPGGLKIPTGKIVVGDPFFLACEHPYEKKVLPGEYPIELIFIDHPDAGKRVAFARLIITNNKAQYWELAIVGDEDVDSLEEDEFFGFPVDAGLACFIDAKICKEFYEKMDELYDQNENFNYYNDILASEFKQNAFEKDNPDDIGEWVNHRFDPAKEDNVIIFSSGYGDGLYPAYWGIDENDEVTCLIIDFLVLGLGTD